MNYKPFLLPLCLMTIAVAAPYAKAQSAQPKSSPAEPLVREQADPKPNQIVNDLSKLPTETDGERIYKGKEVDKRPVVKDKPEPEYTADARRHGVAGTVVLVCVFAATGKVTNIHLTRGLPHGLSEAAIDAASRIKFKPAVKDGKPVSMWIMLEYNFHL